MERTVVGERIAEDGHPGEVAREDVPVGHGGRPWNGDVGVDARGGVRLLSRRCGDRHANGCEQGESDEREVHGDDDE